MRAVNKQGLVMEASTRMALIGMINARRKIHTKERWKILDDGQDVRSSSLLKPMWPQPWRIA